MKLLPKLLLSVLLLTSVSAYSNNVNGGELYYEHIADSTYKFILKIYWNCDSGIPEPSTMTICWYDSCSSYQAFLPLDKTTSTEVPAPCPSNPTRCTSPTSTLSGTKLLIYSRNYQMPSRCTNLKISTYIQNRNIVQNIASGSSGTPLYLGLTFNNMSTPHHFNSMPVSGAPSYVHILQNVPYTYSLNLTDADGDSVTVENTPLATLASQNCALPITAVPFATKTPALNLASNPFQTGNTFRLNAAAKVISFTPTDLGEHSICVRIREYRAGIQLTSYLKEIRFNVIPNPTTYNVTKNILNIESCVRDADTIYACVNTTFRFAVDFKSSDPNTYLYVTDNGTSFTPAPSITYTNQNKDSVRAQFQWTAPPSLAGTGKVLVFTVKDSSCKTNRVFYRTFPVYINLVSKPVALTDTTICYGDSDTLTATLGGGYSWRILPGGTGTISCTTCTNPIVHPLQATSYELTSSVNSYCPNKDTVTIKVNTRQYPSVIITPPVVYYSANTPVTLVAVPMSCTNATYSWSRNGVKIPGATDDTLIITPNIYDVFTCDMHCLDYCLSTNNPYTTRIVQWKAGVEHTTPAMEITIYPNPSNGSFEISGFAGINSNKRYTITTLAGQTILKGSYDVKAGSYKHTLKTNLPAGVYILKLQDDNSSAIRKLIIQ